MLKSKPWQARRILLKPAMYSLFIISIPWYRTSGQFSSVFDGLPDWVLTALLCYAVVNIINVGLWFIESPSE